MLVVTSPVAGGWAIDRESTHGMHGYRGYLELIRPANVATALADVLAGYAVAGLGNPRARLAARRDRLPLCRGRRAQRRLRPGHRPDRTARTADSERARIGRRGIRSGRWACSRSASSPARKPSAAAGVVAAATAACVLLYDAWGKRQGLFGPVNMGMCRGLNLLLGIAAAPASPARGLATGAAAARLHRRSDGGQPGRSARRTARNRGFRSDILECGAGGAAGAGRPARAAGHGQAWRSRLCSGGGCCRRSGAPTEPRSRGRFDTRSGPASCRSCCSTRRSAPRMAAHFTAS